MVLLHDLLNSNCFGGNLSTFRPGRRSKVQVEEELEAV